MKVKVSNIANLPTIYGLFKIQAFKEYESDGCFKEHLVVISKEFQDIVNVRIHSECLTGDTLSSLKCDCGAQLDFALDYIAKNSGIVIYLRQEGRNIGLFNKVNAYNLQDKGLDTVEANHQLGFEADERRYDIVNFILGFYKIKKVNLITNNPKKINSLSVKVVNRIAVIVGQNDENQKYLEVKKTKMGHLFE